MTFIIPIYGPCCSVTTFSYDVIGHVTSKVKCSVSFLHPTDNFYTIEYLLFYDRIKKWRTKGLMANWFCSVFVVVCVVDACPRCRSTAWTGRKFIFRKRENQSLSGKPILIGKTNPYRENQSLSGKPILIGENLFLSGKPILLNKQHATS